MNKRIANDWKYHVIFWATFIIYEVGVSFTFNGSLANFFDYGAHYLLNISLFYFHCYVSLNYSFEKNKPTRFLWLAGFILLELTIYLITKYYLLALLGTLNIPVFRPFVTLHAFIIESGWRAIYFLVLSTGYWFAQSVVKQQRSIAKLENQHLLDKLEKQVLENAYLQSQINPHFLFNTLTFLYTSVNRLSEKLAESIVLLADLMRYSLSGPGPDGKASLEDEIEHVQNFIELNQARFDNRLQLDFQVRGDASGLRIIPLALLTFVENVFKYADLKNPVEPAKICLDIHDRELRLNISNSTRASVSGHSHGIGMGNVKKRLDIYYRDLYILNVKTKENYYQLDLVIKL